MKKRFKTKRRKLKFKYKFIFFLFFFLLGIFISYKVLENTTKKIDDKELVQILLNKSNHHNSIVRKVFKKLNMSDIAVDIIDNNYKKLVVNNTKNKSAVKNTNSNEKIKNDYSDPLIYLYNTHQTEEYKASNFIEYSVGPTVLMNDYILEDVFNKNNLKTITEEGKIKDILNINGWNYSKSYNASRILMESAKSNNPSLKYFIDVHRDSLKHDATTVQINGKSYAKVIFLIGLENPNYEKNLEFTTKINNKINELYPTLSKGIYKKGGEGVNGVYNQDFSEYTILIEIGGPENTVDEVLNSTLAFAQCFMEVIKSDEG